MATEDDAERLRHLVRNGMQRRRQAIVYELAKRLTDRLDRQPLGLPDTAAVDRGGWERIESLSQLRAIVGGRFQNLKEKWVEAGFPLREHRGDRLQKGSVDPTGWVELTVWIGRQGYEARVAGESEEWLFEVRKL